MPKPLDTLLYIILILSCAVVLIRSWPIALALAVASFLYFGLNYIERQRKNEIEELSQKVKHLEERVNGLALSKGLGRG